MNQPPPIPLKYRMIWLLAWWLVWLRARLVVEGVEHVPHGGYIVASNHLSNWDPPVLGLALPHVRLHPLGKEELFRLPLLGRFFRWQGGIPVRRGESDRAALAASRALLKGGSRMMILPEGTRSRTGGLQPGKPGIIFLANLTGAPIVPVGITGTERLGWPWRRTTVVVRFGPPLRFERGKMNAEQREQALHETMRSIAALLPPAYRGVYVAERSA